MSTLTTADPLTTAHAVVLADLIKAVQRKDRVAYLAPDGTTVVEGTLRRITNDVGDVRGEHLEVSMAPGVLRIPVPAAIVLTERGSLVIAPDPF